jgi:hypothetical protein
MQERSSIPEESGPDLDLGIDDEEVIEAAQEGSGPKAKNQAAVQLGRLGGLKGGRARADRLNAEERSRIARRAAQARWSGGNKK